jgi:LacI family transcriptional regulator
MSKQTLNRGSKTEKLEHELIQLVKDGRFYENGPIWPERELCERYGTSRITVRRSLDNLIKKGWLYRIKGKGTYVSPTRQGGKQPLIELVLPIIHEAYFGGIAKGVEKVAEEHGYQVLFALTENKERATEEEILKKAVFEAQGLIIAPRHTYANDAFYDLLVDKFQKVVFINSLPPLSGDTSLDIVLSDDAEGARQAGRHLTSLGHRKIAHFAGCMKLSNAVERLNGYKQAMEEAGLAVEKELIIDCSYEMAKGKEAALELLSQKDRATAIFCASDGMAAGVYEAASQLGLAIPADLSVIGFGDNHNLFPPLTTVSQHSVEIGQEAMKLLLRRIENPDAMGRKVLIPTLLLKRQSCKALV